MSNEILVYSSITNGVSVVPIVTSSATPTFNPTQIAGCSLWLRADLGITQSSGSVSSWADQSGNGRDATQAVANNQPTFTASGINSLPTVSFTPVVFVEFLSLSAGALSSLTAGELFVVAKNTDDGVSISEPCCFTDAGGANYIPFADRKIYDNFGSDSRHDTGYAPAAGVWSSPWLYNVSAITNEWIARLNGSIVFTDATNTVGSFTNCRIGCDPGNAVGMRGNVSEVIIYNSKLSSGDRATVVSYLNTRYNIF